MTVHELARLVGIPAHVVRYYTQRGLLRPERNARNSYRVYVETDLHRLRFICRAKTIGFSLSEIQLILRDVDAGEAPCARVREIVELRAAENAERIARAERLQRRIGEVLRAWSEVAEGPPDHQTLCRLIDAVAFEDDAVSGQAGGATKRR